MIERVKKWTGVERREGGGDRANVMQASSLMAYYKVASSYVPIPQPRFP